MYLSGHKDMGTLVSLFALHLVVFMGGAEQSQL